MELKSYKHRNAYSLITNDLKRHLDYNASMSARHPSGMKIYAELKRKICNVCNIEKDRSEFPDHARRGKVYPRPFCYSCKSLAHFKQDLWKHYRIRFPEYEALYKAQKGKCACCGQDESVFKRQFHVDHDHETGKVRGLLCTQCNPGLGYFQDSIERLTLGIKYLKKFKKLR